MNIRKIYLGLIVLLSMALFYEWSSDQRAKDVMFSKQQAIMENSVNMVSDDGVFVFLENELLRVKISTKTGSVVETRLKKHGVENVSGSVGFRVFGSSETTAFTYYLKTGFTGSSVSYVLDGYDFDFVRLKSIDGDQTKEFRFLDEPYELVIKDSSKKGVSGRAFASLYRTLGAPLDLKLNYSQGGMMNRSSYLAAAISTDQEPYETSRLRNIEEPFEALSRGGWVSFVQKYFFAALLGSEDFIYNFFWQPPVDGKYRMGYTVEKGGVENLVYDHSHRVFVGPKVRKDLIKRAENLELTIDMGWFWFLAQPMVWSLDFINGYVNNWAMAIIVFTLVLKLFLFPITNKGFVSMAQMRKSQPKIKEINDRYKDDPQRKNAEMMKLMKSGEFNPLGGCLPVFVQMPFFIGFFFALREMVELRHADFLWLSDLSVPDPFFVLPVLFGLIMVFTQRLSPTPPTADAMQQQIIQYMPVVISSIFLFLPAALVVYSVLNQAISLVHQRYLYKRLGVLVDPSSGSAG